MSNCEATAQVTMFVVLVMIKQLMQTSTPHDAVQACQSTVNPQIPLPSH